MAERHGRLNLEDLRCCSDILKGNKEQHFGENHGNEGVSCNIGAGSSTICIDDILRIANSLVVLLCSEKKIVSHLAAKSLLALSEQLVNIPRAWMLLIEFMWNIAKGWSCTRDVKQANQALGSNVYWQQTSNECKMISPPFQNSLTTDGKILNHLKDLENIYLSDGGVNIRGASQVILLLKKIMKACLSRHSTSSHCIQNFVKALEQNLVQFVTGTWGLHTDQTISKSYSSSVADTSARIIDKGLMLGALLQLLCSVVQVLAPDPCIGNGIDSHSHDSLLDKLNGLLPMIAHDLLTRDMGHSSLYPISVFLRHKMLMLEVRLSVWFESHPALAWSSLLVLHSAAKDLLETCLLRVDTSVIECANLSSPFASSLFGGLNSKMKRNQEFLLERHLCRRAIFVLIKAFHCLHYHIKTEKSESYQRSVLTTEMTPNLRVSQREGFSKQAAAALLSWIHLQLEPVWKNNNPGKFRLLDNSHEKLHKFTLRLVHLYLDEDILLLEMLLLLLDFADSVCYLRQETTFSLATSVQFSGDSILSHCDNLHDLIMEAFAPLSIFHAFLACLKYDQSVIVDFLISDNTGMITLRYLIRCLRLVTKTWPAFLRLPSGRADEQACSWNFADSFVHFCEMQQKTDDVEEQVGYLMCSSTMKASTSGARKRKLRDLEEVCTYSPVRIGVDVEDSDCVVGQQKQLPRVCSAKAMQCLLCLTKSIERLHNKDLFPYNPSALILRLKSVEQLCRGSWQ
ncbi:hypothetical protein O6H91_18G055700 [Diphasiastrum complanatum]|uniref:Uncharacterized protein n=2 Tax=Diphasiastrum complanatum TaxID=34168 RepID=A0ACC2B2M5_DIPCM|nr:hypothetical protein O6H91_18G055700 [Diphasiastrum complanatum]KAJ7523604.1 hypothetical protein O6H91_18G055700 [Diphasiastrum complanatum]